MSYNNVAMVALMLDSSHLTAEEVAKRDENPALWVAQRYGQPEHIFRPAANRYANGPHQPEGLPALAHYAVPASPFKPATPVLPSRDSGQGTPSQQTESHQHSSSGAFFSTVLSQSSTANEATNSPSQPRENNTQMGQARTAP